MRIINQKASINNVKYNVAQCNILKMAMYTKTNIFLMVPIISIVAHLAHTYPCNYLKLY